MKKLNVLMTVCVLSLIGMMVSCKSTKDSGSPIKGRTEVVKSEAQKYAEEKPSLRAWSSFNSPYERQAARGATAYARAEAANYLKARIKASFKDHVEIYDKISSTVDETKNIKDGENKTNDGVNQITDEIVRGFVVVKTNMYQEANGSYTAYVCVEYSGDLNNLVKETANQIRQQISNDERLKMDFNFEKFQEDLEKEIKDYEEKLKKESQGL